MVGGVDWIVLVQNRCKCSALVSPVMNLRVEKCAAQLVSSRVVLISMDLVYVYVLSLFFNDVSIETIFGCQKD
jgi:hypothetical protein